MSRDARNNDEGVPGGQWAVGSGQWAVGEIRRGREKGEKEHNAHSTYVQFAFRSLRRGKRGEENQREEEGGSKGIGLVMMMMRVTMVMVTMVTMKAEVILMYPGCGHQSYRCITKPDQPYHVLHAYTRIPYFLCITISCIYM